MADKSYIAFKDTNEREDNILKGFRRLQRRNPNIIKAEFLRFAKELIELKGEYEAKNQIRRLRRETARKQIQKLWSRIREIFHVTE